MAMHKGMCGWPQRGAASVKEDATLADYITRKQRQYREKLTFKEWLKKSSFVEPDETTYCWLEECWNAAQENV